MPVHTKEVVEVQAVMLPTVAVPPLKATVPVTMREVVWVVFEQVVVEPQLATL